MIGMVSKVGYYGDVELRFAHSSIAGSTATQWINGKNVVNLQVVQEPKSATEASPTIATEEQHASMRQPGVEKLQQFIHKLMNEPKAEGEYHGAMNELCKRIIIMCLLTRELDEARNRAGSGELWRFLGEWTDDPTLRQGSLKAGAQQMLTDTVTEMLKRQKEETAHKECEDERRKELEVEGQKAKDKAGKDMIGIVSKVG